MKTLFALASLACLMTLPGCSCESGVPRRDAGGDDIGTDGGGEDSGRDGGGDDGGTCTGASLACGDDCCTSNEFCDPNTVCCAFSAACGDRCCGTDETCIGAVCHIACEPTEVRCSNAEGAEICCGSTQVCASGACFTPVTSCTDFIDCPDGQYCEPSVNGGTCLPQPGGETCQLTPMGSSVVPEVVWQWPTSAGVSLQAPTSDQVMMTPMVANITDDNTDGVIDERDNPDVVFISYVDGSYTQNGILRVVDGTTGDDIWSATDPMQYVAPGGQVAIADIDGDGRPEIVACSANGATTGPLIAFEDTGAIKWIASDTNVRCGQAGPSIADLDGDGTVEVFVRYTVVNGADGSYVDHETCDGIGNVGATVRDSHDPCDYTTAANVDGDPELELVGGNVVFDFDATTGLTPLWDYRNCTNSVNCRNDGYPALADFDGDGAPELVVAESSWLNGSTTPSGQAYQGDHWLVVRNAATGAILAGPIDVNRETPPSGDTDAGSCQTIGGVQVCRVAGGGPPTIGNFDASDASPEVALAGAYNYVVFDVDLAQATPAARMTELWHRATNDDSSRKTGSSIFDFDGDGAAEVVYNDQVWLRVMEGDTGETLYCRCNTSATLWEYPVIADVDDNGHAEIVLASNTNNATTMATCTAVAGDQCTADEVAAGRDTSTPGVRVLRGPGEGWIGTRRIWNQHSYHVTNITESGRVPTFETRNWTIGALNNFRLNVQPGATNQPDLRPRNLSVDLSACTATMRVYVEIYNAGWSSAPAGVPVAFYGGVSPAMAYFTTVSTTRSLLPGEFELVSAEFTLTVGSAYDDHQFQVVVNDPLQTPIGSLVECRSGNNTTSGTAVCFSFE
jgi:hypothetical protein